MRPFPLIHALALSALLVTGCAMSAPPMSDPLPAQPDSCNADAAKPAAMGQNATAEVVERARMDASAHTARLLKPGQMVTMEYAGGRLNIDVDASNVVINLRCG